jgi:hypothetical protein
MDTKQLLQTMLPSLEAMKAALESQILLIRQHLSTEETLVRTAPAAPALAPATPASDPTVLGIDTLGRVIRKRTFSPEVLEKKRQLMNEVRERRLQELQELREYKAKHEKAAKPAESGKGKQK